MAVMVFCSDWMMPPHAAPAPCLAGNRNGIISVNPSHGDTGATGLSFQPKAQVQPEAIDITRSCQRNDAEPCAELHLDDATNPDTPEKPCDDPLLCAMPPKAPQDDDAGSG
ncbi:hypothetical protein [Paragemmobacter aquarius]|uniref:hypothetical protein n=1 Tax=Paragemmobacter aquarius TaxID=2169400 RepID=UPI00131EFDDF|nr:hypothetical protein [Gemmobacter aquarius]